MLGEINLLEGRIKMLNILIQIASLSDRFAVRSALPVRSLRCQTNFVMGVKDE